MTKNGKGPAVTVPYHQSTMDNINSNDNLPTLSQLVSSPLPSVHHIKTLNTPSQPSSLSNPNKLQNDNEVKSSSVAENHTVNKEELSPSDSFSISLSVWIVFSSMFLDCLLMTLPISFLSDALVNTGADAFEVGILFGSKAAVQIIFNPLLGYVVNVLGPIIPLLGGSIVITMSTAIFAIVPLSIDYYYWLIVARSIQGIATSTAFVAGASYLSLVFPNDEERGAALGSAMAGYGLASVVGPILGGLLYWAGGQMLPFLLVSGLAFLQFFAFLYFFYLRRPPLSEFINRSRGVGTKFPSFGRQLTVMMDPYVLILCFALALVNMALSMQEFLYPIYLAEQYDNPSSWIVGLSFLPLCLGYCITTPLVGRYGLILGRYIFICLGLVIVGVTLICFPLPNNLILQIFLMTGLGLGLGCIDGSTPPLLAQLLDLRHSTNTRGGLYGIVFAAADLSFSLGYVVGAALGSWLDKSFGYDFLCRTTALALFIVGIPLFASRGVIGKENAINPSLKENFLQDKEREHDDEEEETIDGEEEEEEAVSEYESPQKRGIPVSDGVESLRLNM